MKASRDGHLAQVEAFLRKGARLDTRDCFGNTALYYAAARGRVDVVALLIAYGADPFDTPRVRASKEVRHAAVKGLCSTFLWESVAWWMSPRVAQLTRTPEPVASLILAYAGGADLLDDGGASLSALEGQPSGFARWWKGARSLLAHQ
jgi:hypothetical protein